MQLEAAALRQLQQFHIQEDTGQDSDFTSVQVMLYSSRKFGPESIRHLQVGAARLVCALFCTSQADHVRCCSRTACHSWS